MASKFPSPTSVPLAHSASATVDSLLFLKHIRHIPTSEPLPWLFPLPGMPFPALLMADTSSGFSLTITSSGKQSLTTRDKRLSCHSDVPQPEITWVIFACSRGAGFGVGFLFVVFFWSEFQCLAYSWCSNTYRMSQTVISNLPTALLRRCQFPSHINRCGNGDTEWLSKLPKGTTLCPGSQALDN